MQPFATRLPALAALLLLAAPSAHADPCGLTPDLSAPPALTDVCGAGSGPPPILARFDTLAWQTFLRLVWPASNIRGIPDDHATLTAAGHLLTFGTMKARWEVFPEPVHHPAAWNTWPATAEPCAGQSRLQYPGQLVLGSFHEFGNVTEPQFNNLLNGLAAQNHTFVRYLAAFDQNEFNLITANGFYEPNVVQNRLTQWPALAPGDPFNAQNDTIIIKTAWVELREDVPQAQQLKPSRFFWRPAWVQDHITGACTLKRMALVGMHIIHKTASRSAWIWATFEQIDNVPDNGTPPGRRYTFNNGGFGAVSTPPTDWRLSKLIPTAANIRRFQNIEKPTRDINAAWQAAFARVDSVWQYYRLVMTQWPSRLQPYTPADQDTPTPPCNMTNNTATANVTMETFFQQPAQCNGIQLTCMSCHAAASTDNIFALQLPSPPKPGQMEPLLRLRTLNTVAAMITRLRNAPNAVSPQQ